MVLSRPNFFRRHEGLEGHELGVLGHRGVFLVLGTGIFSVVLRVVNLEDLTAIFTLGMLPIHRFVLLGLDCSNRTSGLDKEYVN